MARVNHGNLLQHAVECDVAGRLAEGAVGLRLVATHAMAPWEPPHGAADAAEGRILADLLGTIACMPPGAGDAAPVPVVRAYARAGATPARYPNTAELLAALVGREALQGMLCEVAPEAVLALAEAWAGTDVRVEGRCWRDALAAGALLPPADLDRPWLLTLDPYTWKHDGECTKATRGPFLLRADLEALRPILAAHAHTGWAGACLIFVYGVDPSHASAFRRAALGLADRVGLARAVVGVPAREGTRHLCAVLSTEPDLPAQVAEGFHAMWADLAGV